MAAIVQSAAGRFFTDGDVVLPSDPTPGNTVLLWKAGRSLTVPPLTVQDGFTELASVEHNNGNVARGSLQSRLVEIGDTAAITAEENPGVSGVLSMIVVEVEGDIGDVVDASFQSANPVLACGGSVSADDGDIVIGFASIAQASDEPIVTAIAADFPAAELGEVLNDYSDYPSAWAGYLASGGGTESIEATLTKGDGRPIYYSGVTVVVLGESPPPAEPGSETPYEPQPPARALIEIYVPGPDAARWDEALWDAATWSSAEWTDITHLCVSADISWGVTRPDAGILSDVEAGLWTVITYDPDRILDPANASSPYSPAITYGLPIRISHRGRVIRTGYCESISYSYESSFGIIRATDNVAALAAVKVSSEVELPDTLFARARAAINAAGLPIDVLDAPGGDPDLAPWEPGDFTAWEIIRQSAREVHYLPFIQSDTRLTFRAWDAPIDRGGVIGSPEMIDLQPSVSADSLYSIVQVTEWAPGPTLTDIERRITPLPRYGERVYDRQFQTINGGAWADRVLEDRAQSGLRYSPGAIFPLDADSVEYLSGILMNEFLTVDYPEATPDVEVRVRVLGERIRVVDLGGQAGPDWRWWLQTTTSYLSPLIADDVEPAEILVDDADGVYLYPDGVVGLEA